MSATTTARTRPAGAAAVPTEAVEQAAPGRSRKKLVVVVLIALVGVAAAGWFFLLRPDGDAAEPKPVAGEVLSLEPMSINLAGGHYLRVGIALQVVEKPKQEIDGSKALDLTISTLSGRQVADLTDSAKRDAIKAELTAKVAEAYDDDVMALYFTEFVTQ
ncbi:MAG TPA: flagellar basal body-associated FliL family protein [Actinomycetales bacterium]|nr:flagellar basal body-associated FliL family protein [Actinomycetales bacterium]